MAREPKKYSEKDIMEDFKKKSYPYKVSLLKDCLKEAIKQNNPEYKEVNYLANALGYEEVFGFDEPRWIKKQ